jgi:adenylate kinase
VLFIDVPRAELIKRLTGRRVCRACGAMAHVVFSPPARAGVCDRCGGVLYQREDDREETIVHRLDVYNRETAPVLDYYRQAGLLREVPGTGSPDQVFQRVAENVQ